MKRKTKCDNSFYETICWEWKALGDLCVVICLTVCGWVVIIRKTDRMRAQSLYSGNIILFKYILESHMVECSRSVFLLTSGEKS